MCREALTAVTQANGVMTPPMIPREAFVVLAERDLAITLEFARELGVPIPATALCSQLMAEVAGLKGRKTA